MARSSDNTVSACRVKDNALELIARSRWRDCFHSIRAASVVLTAVQPYHQIRLADMRARASSKRRYGFDLKSSGSEQKTQSSGREGGRECGQ